MGQAVRRGRRLAIAEAAAKAAGAPLIVIARNSRAAEALSGGDRVLRGRRRPGRTCFPTWRRCPTTLLGASGHHLVAARDLGRACRARAQASGSSRSTRSCSACRRAATSRRYSLQVHVGETLDLDALRARLALAGYAAVTQVAAHGEFAVRGSLLDVFPMGSDSPYRIDMLDRDVDSIRISIPTRSVRARSWSASTAARARDPAESGCRCANSGAATACASPATSPSSRCTGT